MGRGDRKSRKGKIFRGSYGVVRPRKTESAIRIPTKKKEVTKEPTAKKKAAVKKKAAKKPAAKKE
jgi:30S ribosomal protein S31